MGQSHATHYSPRSISSEQGVFPPDLELLERPPNPATGVQSRRLSIHASLQLTQANPSSPLLLQPHSEVPLKCVCVSLGLGV